jgi:hypothetical protein
MLAVSTAQDRKAAEPPNLPKLPQTSKLSVKFPQKVHTLPPTRTQAD